MQIRKEANAGIEVNTNQLFLVCKNGIRDC